MSGLQLTDVIKRYGKTQVIHGIDLTIEDGEFCVFVGPSGCGKSTLLRMVAGLEETTEGSIDIGGRDVTRADPAARGVAMVFQTYALYPHMTVAENMGFGLKMNGYPKKEVAAKVGEASRILKLDDYLERKPKALSGGQRQRVAIGRAIVRKPKGFLFDEPLSNLDASLRVDMRFEIARLHKALETTMVYVTHDQVEAMTLADRIVVLKDGLIMQVGTPRELYETPDNVFVAQFIGSPKMNLMPCTTADGKFALEGGGNGPISETRDGAVQLGIRPEHIGIADVGAGHCDGVVQISEYLGADFFHYVDCGPLGLLTVRTPGAFEDIEGKTIGLKFEHDNLHFFAANGHVL